MSNLKLPWCNLSDRNIFTMQLIFFATFDVTNVKQESVSVRRMAEKHRMAFAFCSQVTE